MSRKVRYFVEGDCEKKFLRTFIYDEELFLPGKIHIINFVGTKINPSLAKTILNDTTVVIVIDTDVDNIDTLEDNLKLLTKYAGNHIKEIILVLSVDNFEDELVYSCDGINKIDELFKTKGTKEFKNKFIRYDNLQSKLLNSGFKIEKIWSRSPKEPFNKYENGGHKIKLTK